VIIQIILQVVRLSELGDSYLPIAFVFHGQCNKNNQKNLANFWHRNRKIWLKRAKNDKIVIKKGLAQWDLTP
jgi:hypothetical protein